ncbi:MAG: T9SS type A sorting domain-containing protein [Bacteroidetes bacterium]|nr:T9SS type A sorting domain-containing protein [Bacteroidota bacterium]
MKKLYFFLFILIISYNLKAQPVITANVLPVVGDTMLMSFDSTLISAGVSGANVNWDFSAVLHQDFYFQRIYLSPANTPYSATFPSAVLCRTDGIGSAYSYWNNSNSSKSVCYGFVEPNNYTQHYNNLPISYYKFPISFGNAYVDSVSAVTNPGNIIGPGKYYFNADAWGSIKLPNKTVSNVLRTKSVLYIGDSTINSYSLTTEYAWYQANKKEPLLVISSVIINHALYKKYVLFDNTAASGIENIEATTIFNIWPNPAKDLVNLSFDGLKINNRTELSVYDSKGEKIFAEKLIDFSSSGTLDIRFFPKGLYIIRVDDSMQSFELKFIKE